MESNYDITLKELYIPSKHEKDTYLCEDFIIYPEGKEKNGGFLMGIIEIRANDSKESEKIIQTIINSLKENYYNQISTSPEPHKLNLETVFEHALQKTNAAIVEMIQIGHINIVFENLNYVIAIAKPNQTKKEIDFIFAQQGLINVYLLHKTKQNNYKVINIVDNTPKVKENQTENLKIFSSTINGKIFQHNALYMCSEIFGNYIPAHKVNKIISTNDLSSSIDYFKNQINNVKNNSYLTYCAIFIKMEEKRQVNDQPVSQKSLNNLIDTTEKTERFLSQTTTINVLSYLRKAFSWLKSKKNSRNLRSPKSNYKIKFGTIKYILNIFKILAKNIKKTFVFAINLFKKKKNKPAEKTEYTPQIPKHKSFNLPKNNKAILIILTIIVVVFISGIFWIKHNKQVKQEQAVYSAQIQNVKNLINNAQVNLIYKNENESLKLIKEAEDIIKYLPQATTDQKANYTELTRQSDSIKNKLLHITKVTPQLVSEIKDNETPINLAGMEIIDEKVYLNNQNNQLYSVNITNQNTNNEGHSDVGDFRFSGTEDDKLIYITNQNKLIEYNQNSGNFTNLSIDWGENLNISGIQLYSNNLYVIDNNNKQIYKWRRNADNYGSRSEWLSDKGDADLSQASSLTIDGNIYVATNSGQLYKFFTGSKENFTLATIEPELTQIKKIYTNPDINNIYLLDANSNRIIAVNKEGAFIAQYQFDLLDAKIADFSITNNKLYFISGNKLYQAEL